MNKNTYKVIITNKTSFSLDQSLVIGKLADLFKISHEKAEQILNKKEFIVKDNIDKVTAEKYLAAIHRTGADCRIINRDEQRAIEEMNNHNDISEKLFCIECGSIKESSGTCENCGFDPQPSKTKGGFKKPLKYASITVGIILITIIAYQLAIPFYNKYAHKQKIDLGMELAYETRDTITNLILETNFWPNQNIDANLPKHISNEVIESLIVGENALITVTIRAEALKLDSSQTIIFKPAASKGKLIWNCTAGTLKNEFRPDVCKNGNQ